MRAEDNLPVEQTHLFLHAEYIFLLVFDLVFSILKLIAAAGCLFSEQLAYITDYSNHGRLVPTLAVFVAMMTFCS